VAWFDVPVNELLLVDRSQTSSDLGRDFQSHLYLQPPGAFDQLLQRFPLDKGNTTRLLFRVSIFCNRRGRQKRTVC
jgi:hypothetical protein